MEFHQIDDFLAMMAKYACMDIKQSIITARKRSCGKVMFSQVSVCPQGVGISSPMFFSDGGGASLVPGPFLKWVGYVQGLGVFMSRGCLWGDGHGIRAGY